MGIPVEICPLFVQLCILRHISLCVGPLLLIAAAFLKGFPKEVISLFHSHVVKDDVTQVVILTGTIVALVGWHVALCVSGSEFSRSECALLARPCT